MCLLDGGAYCRHEAVTQTKVLFSDMSWLHVDSLGELDQDTMSE